MKTLTSKFLFLTLILLFSSSLLANITYNLDREEIHENESFKLKVLIENPANLRSDQILEVLPEDLQLLSRQQFNNSSMINGKFASEMGWELQLIAAQAGTYTIPAYRIGNEQAEPMIIKILPAIDEITSSNSNAKVSIRANLSAEQVYVQQQIIYTLRLYHSVVTRHPTITPLRVNGALVEKLGDERRFKTVQNNTTYQVYEQKYAIFPQQSGEMVIQPITFSASIADEAQNNNPWGLSRSKPISLSTQQYTVQVKPKPDTAAEPWLPTINLKLEAQWQPSNQKFVVGKPATLDFIIKGTGLLQSQLPQVSFPETNHLKIYRDQPQMQSMVNHQGIISYHLEKVAVIPSQAGELTIPEIKIAWWNTETDKQEYATLPTLTIAVEEAAVTVDDNESNTIPNAPVTETSTLDSSSPLLSVESQTWKYIAIVFAALWLLTLLLLFRKKSSPISEIDDENSQTDDAYASNDTQQRLPTSKNNPSKNSNLKMVKDAALANDAEKTSKLLLSWITQLKGFSEVNNLNQLASKVQGAELKAQLKALQQALYSSQDSAWQGKDLAKTLDTLKTEKVKKQKLDRLPDLYS